MSINLSKAIESGNWNKQSRVKRYDVKFGVPSYAITYKRFCFSKLPHLYYGLSNFNAQAGIPNTNKNWGTLGSSYDLTETGTLNYVPGYVDPTEMATNFSGGYMSSSAVPAYTVNTINTQGFTGSVWIKPDTVPSGSDAMAIMSYGSGSTNHGFSLYLVNNGAGKSLVKLKLSNSVILTSNTVLPDTWTNITFTIAKVGSNYVVKLYQQGEEVATGTGSNYVAWTNSGTGAETFRIAVNDPIQTNPVNFDGLIDEIGLWYLTFDQQDIKKLYTLGINSTYVEPDEDFENDVIGIINKTSNYAQLITEDAPVHLWKMEQRLTSGFTYTPDEGSISAPFKRDLKLYGYAATNYSTPVLNTKTGTVNSMPFSNTEGSGQYGQSYGRTEPGMRFNTTGTVTDWSVEFWYRSKANSGEPDLVLGWDGVNVSGGFSGQNFTVIAQNNRLRLFLGGVFTLTTNQVMGLDSVHHIALTYSISNNSVLLYVDGSVVGSTACNSFGANPSASSRFCVADQQHLGQQDHQGFNLGYVAIYDKVLSANSIAKRYRIGTSGPFFDVTLNGGDPATQESPYQLSANQYSELLNEVDITKYVIDYNVSSDTNQLVSTGSMLVAEPWDSSIADTLLKPNTYVVIEQRYTADASGYDSGWLSLGHFLVDGPVQRSVSGDGTVSTVVALKSPLKLLSLDVVHKNYEPDKLFVPKTKLDVVETASETISFSKSHHLGNGMVLGNWAQFPSPKMWAKDFTAISSEESELGGISYLNEEIRIKGAQGSVQVLGGAGKVVFDLDYFTTPISNDGIGNPSLLYAEFYRYAQSYDSERTRLSDIKFTDNWFVTIGSKDVNAHGKTVFMRSGDAKGKVFKVRQTGLAANTLFFSNHVGSTNSSVAVSGSTLTGWTQQLTDPLGLYAGETWRVSGTHTTSTVKYSNMIKMLVPVTIPSNVPDTAILKGARIVVKYRTNTGNYAEQSPDDLPIQDNVAYLSITGGLTASDIYSNNLARNGRWIDKTTLPPALGTYTRNMTSDLIFGGALDPLGFKELTAGQIRANISNMAFFYSVRSTGNATYNGQAFYADVAMTGVELAFEWLPDLTLTDIYGNVIHPEYEGIKINDQIQLGNHNAVEDVYRLLLTEAGFQENDPTKPFYFSLEESPRNLAPSVPPLKNFIQDNRTRLDILQDVSENYSLPDYKIYVDSDGVVRAELMSSKYGSDATILLPPSTSVDYNIDGSDINIITRVIVEGANASSVNIGLNATKGGFSAVHAYKLNQYASSDAGSLDGRTLSQSDANNLLIDVFDSSSKTPVPPTGSGWLYDGQNKYYGTLWYRYGPRSQVKRWDFEDQPLFALDIGRNGNGSAIEVDYMEVVTFNHFFSADNSIGQTGLIYYMTEADYEAEFKKKAPGTVSQTDTSYFPPANANSWKLLVDEIAFNETTRISSSDFVDEKPVKARFFKFVVGQCQYRFPIVGVDDNVATSINFANIKIYNSSLVRASAELGVDGEFSDVIYKEMATRLRRRSEFLSGNVLLDTYDKVKDFALSELRERIVDYTPTAITTTYPHIQIYDVVYWTNPKTRLAEKFLVGSVSVGMRKPTQCQIHNYNSKELL